MSHLYSTTSVTRKKHTHLSYQDRQKLEGLVRSNHLLSRKNKVSQKHMAAVIQCSQATLSRELKKGSVVLMNYDLTHFVSYSAEIAQNAYDYAATNKGPKLKIGNDHEFADYVAQKILEENWSPDAIVMDLKKKEISPVKTMVSTRTLYNYISKGYISGVGNTDLPREGKQTRRPYKRVQRANKNLGAPIITERPVESTERSEPGHWEMDCIVSGKGKGLAALLTLNDRMTRESLVFKLPRQTNAEVVKILNRLERRMGRVKFSDMFKSLTVDNGSEFLDWNALQKSVMGSKKPRTLVFFCHPYSSWERGTNEQNNGLIRYHIPKGAAIKAYTHEQIRKLQEWLNNYPRRVLDGLTANEAKARYHPGRMYDPPAEPTGQGQAH